ncbi:MAG: hypothetical protein A2X99_04050 [Deltaproteobacteria bacterium GWB2_55_19]|nr:MAG: hypothetical protein A2X99_04050 [Deltaproteobacteria bacterium GWB2_55_19]HAO92660.1 hypothetical protein [Deltaproteobacteria bacterium]
MIEINSYQNGTHSMGMGLKAFDEFVKDPSNPYLLKDAIIRTHHGLETLFKHILFEMNPAFILPQNYTVEKFIDLSSKYITGENTYLVDEANTIGLLEILDRLKKFHFFGKLSEQEFHQIRSATKTLIGYRNQLQHFAISANEDILARLIGNLVPRSVDVLSRFYRSLNDDLRNVFSRSIEVIELLSTQYDRLIQEAIQHFRGKQIDDLDLALNIKDYGYVGAPPYMPELILQGFIIAELSPHKNAISSPWPIRNEMPARYDSKLEIIKPTVLECTTALNKLVQAGFRTTATIFIDDPKNVINIQDSNEQFAFLRSIKVELGAILNYKALAHFDEHHYMPNEVSEIEGDFELVISAVSMGSKESKPEILGKFHSKLSKENSTFKFHSFVMPGGILSDNYNLNWTINAISPLKFNA